MAQLRSPPLLWRYGCCRSRMTEVTSSQVMVPMFLLTVHDHVHHIDGASTVLGPPWLPTLSEGSTCPLGETGTLRGGSGTFYDAGGLGRGGEISPEMPYRVRGLSARLGWDEFVVRTLSG
jgi:hypothetical protein